MGSEFMSDILEIDGYIFSLIWTTMEKVDEKTDLILMIDTETNELYGGYLKHDTRFLKKFEKLKEQ